MENFRYELREKSNGELILTIFEREKAVSSFCDWTNSDLGALSDAIFRLKNNNMELMNWLGASRPEPNVGKLIAWSGEKSFFEHISLFLMGLPARRALNLIYFSY